MEQWNKQQKQWSQAQNYNSGYTIKHGKRTGSSVISQWLVEPFLGTTKRRDSNDLKSDCEMTLAEDFFSLLKWRMSRATANKIMERYSSCFPSVEGLYCKLWIKVFRRRLTAHARSADHKSKGEKQDCNLQYGPRRRSL